MSDSYTASRCVGSIAYDNSRFNTNQTPGQIPYHSHGILSGIRPTPPQFYPQQEPVYSDMNTNARQQYKRARVNRSVLAEQIRLSDPIGYVVKSSNNSSHMNYIPPINSSLYVNIKKSNAVGQTAYKVNLPNDSDTGTKSYFQSSTRSSIRRMRSGGCVAPKKKGAIENFNGAVGGWGSMVRQNY